MTCPHCGKVIVRVCRSEAKYREDVKRAEAAIRVLERVPYPELYKACLNEKARLQAVIANPAKLYVIYRRADKKTPIAYGLASE
jgi:hypothetical protein